MIHYIYLRLICIKYSVQHIESAIQDCTRAIELDPDYLKAYIRRSKLFERNDKLDEALEDLKKILEIDRNYAEAAYNARVCYHDYLL